MENAVNIMAMIQGNSIVKKKFDVPSKPLGNDKTSFKNEFNQAKKDITRDYSIDNKAVEGKTQSTTEKKIEKFAKVMANNNAKTEIKTEVKTEVKENSSVETLEQKDETEIKSNLAVVDVKQLEQIEADVNVEEPIESVLDMLQQLIEMMQSQKNEGASNQQLTELKTKFQEVFQKLGQALEMTMTNQTSELSTLLSSLKNELSELVAKLEIVPEHELDSKQTEQLINQLADKLNQAKTLNHQVLQETEETKNKSEGSKLPFAHVVKLESNEVEYKNNVKAVEVTDETQQIQKTDTDKTFEDKTSDSQDNEEDETTYKANEKSDVLKTTTGDKISQTNDNKVVAPQVDKENFQLNMKQANVNLQKDSLVKFNKSDIMNQVIKKADIFVQGSHQEMVMKLEPESLGKLNLKIVLENGLITAKFQAESQQVKAILESSFNQLKDALQEKGITVQSLSVSVNQQGAEFSSGQGFDQWKKSIKLNNKTSGQYMGLDEESSISMNPYSYHDGKVDYRA